MRRRGFLAGAAATSLLLPSCKSAQLYPAAAVCPVAAGSMLIEREAGGRLGVAVLDTHSGRMKGHRLDERFGMCSTFKLALAAIILREIEWGPLKAEQWVPYGKDDMVFHAPVTEKNLEKGGMTVVALAEAAQKTSDNVAANLLLKLIGGPEGFTEKLRAIGDEKTRIDRYEPEMNLVPPGEVRDTTTPAAMAATVSRFFSADMIPALNSEYLTPFGRERLKQWTIDTKTGLKRLRAGLPADWIVGDKTGTGRHKSMPNKHNDIAICWPPGRAEPIIVTAYYDAPGHFEKIRAEDDAVLAKVGRLVGQAMT